MRKFKLSECGDRGWFIGNFEKAAHKTDQFEVAYKFSPKGETGESHYHKIATEITLVATGSVHMNGLVFNSGDIFILEPNEVSVYECLEDTFFVTIKTPGAKNDKYLV